MNTSETTALKIFITIFLFSALFFKPSLSFPRFEHVTKAIVETHKTSIDEIQNKYQILVSDRFKFNNKTFIEPTPGISIIGLATYLPYHLWIKPKLVKLLTLDNALEFQLSQFVIALSTVIPFSALLVSVFFLSLRNKGCPIQKAIFYSFFLYFGTPVMFYSLGLNSGQNLLEAALLFLSFYALRASESSKTPVVFLSGIFAGLAIFANASGICYLLLYPLLILFCYRKVNLLFWIIGFCFGILPLLIYNAVSFGHPLTTSYMANHISLILDPVASLKVVSVLLFEPQVGLIFFTPFLLLLIPLAPVLCRQRLNIIILCATAFFIVGLSVLWWSLLQKLEGIHTRELWYFNQGGGGPRYLLPVIPFLLYIIANEKLTVAQNRIALPLIALSVLINVPGLFWSGGSAFFLNNLFLFLKNGFHSYLIDLISELLANAGFNTDRISLWPTMTIFSLFLWWLWGNGGKTIRSLSLNLREEK